MGKKRGLYLARKTFSKIKIPLKTPVKFVFYRGDDTFNYFTTYNRVVSLRYEVLKFLKDDKEVIFQIKPINNLKNPNSLFKNGYIDLAYYIPKATSKGSKVICEAFEKNGQNWLSLWSYHTRGSSEQITLRRYLDIELFGNFLGQMQAEGTKRNAIKLEFANKLSNEHTDFIKSLVYFGMDERGIITDCIYHKKVEKIIGNEIEIFQNMTGRHIKGKYMTFGGKGGFGFKTYIRNSLATDVFLSSLDITRRNLIMNLWGKYELKLFEAFFAKLLTGDGNLDIDSKNRNTPQARIKIVDGNANYLRDYAELMKKYGLNPHINEKHIWVRASINPYFIKRLHEIRAFYNTPNYEKLSYLLDKRKIN